MVRPPSSIWGHFELIKPELGSLKKKGAVICKYCNKKYQHANATKMTAHIVTCAQYPFDLSPLIATEMPHSDGMDQSTDFTAVLWKHFKTIVNPKTNKKMVSICKYCNSKVNTPNPTKMAKHISICVKYLENAKQISLKDESSSSAQATETSPFIENSRINNPLDQAFARAVFASNCSMAISENQYWKDFVKKLHPTYKLPSRESLSNRLLDEEYISTRNNINMQISKATSVTIITDGWNNTRRDNLVNYTVTTQTPLFYKYVEVKSDQLTGEYIANDIEKIILEIGEDKVDALVTDNSSNMKLAWQIIKNRYPKINTIGCAAHVFNLLLEDVVKIKSIDNLIQATKSVVKSVKKSQAALNTFTTKQAFKLGKKSATLKLPVTTRLSSIADMIDNILKGRESLQETVFEDDSIIDSKIQELILDEDFWNHLHIILNILNPIITSIGLIKSITAHLSDVTQQFYVIKERIMTVMQTSFLSADEQSIILQMIDSRRKFCNQGIYYAANILDPRYRGDMLLECEVSEGINFIVSMATRFETADILANLAQYRSNQNIWANEAVWETAKQVMPLTWWGGLMNTQPLYILAKILLSIPPSSAMSERIWSAIRDTQAKQRYALTNDSLTKLVAVRCNLMLQASDDVPMLNDCFDPPSEDEMANLQCNTSKRIDIQNHLNVNPRDLVFPKAESMELND